MAKKTIEPVEELKSSAQKIWLAGLGALAEAEKHGDKIFRSLVQRGKNYGDLLPDATEAVKGSVETARKQASQALQDMESAFDRQVQNAMKRMGVATKAEVDALKRELTKLRKAAETKAGPKRKSAAGKKKAAKKSTTARKPVKKAKKKTTGRRRA